MISFYFFSKKETYLILNTISHDYIPKKKKKTKGLTQFYFNLLILKTTHFHTIDYSTSTVLFIPKNIYIYLRHVILFTSQLHIYHIRVCPTAYLNFCTVWTMNSDI